MSNPQVAPGEVVTVGPPAAVLPGVATGALVRAPGLDVLRLVVPAGREVAEHAVTGTLTVHCLEGAVDFTAGGETRRLGAGQLLHLPPGAPHSLHGVADAALLVTIFRA
ncbi:MAG TPA: cupin domain-containing protein [Gemmata sp.]